MVELINSLLFRNFKQSKVNDLKGLPVYMFLNRNIYKIEDEIITFIMVDMQSDDSSIESLKKQLKQYHEYFQSPVVYCFESITKKQYNSLIENHISFISCDHQIYLPFLGLSLHSNFKVEKQIKIDKMMPITQCLFLYLLYNCRNRKIMKIEAAKELHVTKMSITRASEQLEKMGLIKQESKGRQTLIWTELVGYELFKKAKPYLISPIQKRIIVKNQEIFNHQLWAGEYALAKCTMLNAPLLKCKAIEKSLVKDIDLEYIDKRWESTDQAIEIELWKYDPLLFGNETVDIVSLYMTLKDSFDERIEGMLEEMLEEYNW